MSFQHPPIDLCTSFVTFMGLDPFLFSELYSPMQNLPRSIWTVLGAHQTPLWLLLGTSYAWMSLFLGTLLPLWSGRRLSHRYCGSCLTFPTCMMDVWDQMSAKLSSIPLPTPLTGSTEASTGQKAEHGRGMEGKLTQHSTPNSTLFSSQGKKAPAGAPLGAQEDADADEEWVFDKKVRLKSGCASWPSLLGP